MSQKRFRTSVFLAFALIAGAGGAQAQESLTPGSFKAYAAEGVEARVSTFSGQPVPRYASLKYNEVNGRSGPSPDYPVRWKYERAGLPVIIIRESKDWRMVRDPLGDEVWINSSQLSAQHTAITKDAGVMYREPRTDAGLVARFKAGAVVALGDCGNLWCRVEAEGRKGWVKRAALWGAEPLPKAPGQ